MLSEMIKGFVDVFMISKTKLDNSFSGGQFFIEGYHTSFRFDRNRNVGGILLYIHKDIPTKVIYCDFHHLQALMLKLIFIRKNSCQIVPITQRMTISVII